MQSQEIVLLWLNVQQHLIQLNLIILKKLDKTYDFFISTRIKYSIKLSSYIKLTKNYLISKYK
jgi:hypothetical protein